MPAGMLIKFGSYTMPSTISPVGLSDGRRMATTDRLMRDGTLVGDATRKEHQISFKGMLRSDTLAGLVAARDALLAAMHSGRQYLTLMDDRQVAAVCTGCQTDWDPTGYQRYCYVALDFTADVPYWEALEDTQTLWEPPASGTPYQVTAGGNARTPVTAGLYIDAGGTSDISLTVNGTVCRVQISGWPAATWVWIDTATLTAAGKNAALAITVPDASASITGLWPVYQPGVNTITYTRTSGSAATKLLMRYRARWF